MIATVFTLRSANRFCALLDEIPGQRRPTCDRPARPTAKHARQIARRQAVARANDADVALRHQLAFRDVPYCVDRATEDLAAALDIRAHRLAAAERGIGRGRPPPPAAAVAR